MFSNSYALLVTVLKLWVPPPITCSSTLSMGFNVAD